MDTHLVRFSGRRRWSGSTGSGFRHAGYSRSIGPLLCLFAGGLAIYGYLRWLRNEKAMRLKEDLPYTHSLLIISAMLTIVAVIVMVLVLYAG